MYEIRLLYFLVSVFSIVYNVQLGIAVAVLTSGFMVCVYNILSSMQYLVITVSSTAE